MIDLSHVYDDTNAPFCVVYSSETSSVLSSGETAGEAVREALRVMDKGRMIKEGVHVCFAVSRQDRLYRRDISAAMCRPAPGLIL